MSALAAVPTTTDGRNVTAAAELLVELLSIADAEGVPVLSADVWPGAPIIHVRDEHAAARLGAALLLRLSSQFTSTRRTRTPFGWRLTGLVSPSSVHAAFIQSGDPQA